MNPRGIAAAMVSTSTSRKASAEGAAKRAAFEQYDKENPQIWREFVRVANMAREKGFTSYSAKGIFEIIRWETSSKGNDMFKLNNNYHADYARKLLARFPKKFEGFFRLRTAKADQH